MQYFALSTANSLLGFPWKVRNYWPKCMRWKSIRGACFWHENKVQWTTASVSVRVGRGHAVRGMREALHQKAWKYFNIDYHCWHFELPKQVNHQWAAHEAWCILQSNYKITESKTEHVYVIGSHRVAVKLRLVELNSGLCLARLLNKLCKDVHDSVRINLVVRLFKLPL